MGYEHVSIFMDEKLCYSVIIHPSSSLELSYHHENIVQKTIGNVSIRSFFHLRLTFYKNRA